MFINPHYIQEERYKEEHFYKQIPITATGGIKENRTTKNQDQISKRKWDTVRGLLFNIYYS